MLYQIYEKIAYTFLRNGIAYTISFYFLVLCGWAKKHGIISQWRGASCVRLNRGDCLLSDFEPMIREFEHDIKVYPISDLHIGSVECQVKRWEQFKRQLLSEPNSYITIGGDMMNNATRSSVSNVFEETMRPREQKKWLAEQLSDIKDRILCVVSGNHCARSGKDADDSPLYDVCCKLDIEDLYRDNVAFLILRFGDKSGSGLTNPTYTACVTHGAGGGIYTGASVNRNERFASYIDGLDILIVGHSHKGALTKPQKIVIDAQNKRVSYKDYTVITSTSWMDYGGYALRKMLSPASCQVQTLSLKRNHKQVEVIW